LAWTIEFDEKAERDLAGLDKSVQREIRRYLRERIAPLVDPTVFGKPLRHEYSGVWRYRVRDYRILCRIEDEHLIVLVIAVGHRDGVYE